MELPSQVDEMILSGVPPLSLDYAAVMRMVDGKTIGFRSVLKINSLDLGVLGPDEYNYVAGRSAQIVKLAVWALKEVCDASHMIAEEQLPYEWISVALPLKMIMKDDFEENLFSRIEKNGGDKAHICVEFPMEVLYEDADKVKKILTDLRAAGVASMLTGYGNAFCPALRLDGLPFTYVLLDRELSLPDKINQSATVARMVKANGSHILFDDIGSRESASFRVARSNAADFVILNYPTDEISLFSRLIPKGGEAEV